VYDACRPPYAAHGLKYIAVDKDGFFYLPFDLPSTRIPPTTWLRSAASIRTPQCRYLALGVRNASAATRSAPGKSGSPKRPRLDSLRTPSDKRHMISKIGEQFLVSLLHQGTAGS